ncbi:hypothetical protein BH24ACI5_BH24ACI5_26280 [soil metagenome]
MKLTASLVMVAMTAPLAIAQTPAVRKVGVVEYIQAGHAGITRDLVAAAERMPEADYGFKPSQMNEARTYGAVIAHAADGMFAACARAKSLPNPVPDVEKKAAGKAEIVKALAQSIAFCEDAFSGLTVQNANEYVRQGPVEIPRQAVLIGLLAHNAEMYGISTVYLRAKNLVPPASERR